MPTNNETNHANQSDSLSSILAGFDVVPSDSIPSITLDNQRRFNVTASARRLMNLRPYDRLHIAYSSSKKALAIVNPRASIDEALTAELATSNYNVDKRYYMSARYFADKYGYAPASAPYYFDYDYGSADGSVFVFRLRL